MKSFITFASIFVLLLIAIIVSIQHKEGFMNEVCHSQKDCVSCTKENGCSWCPSEKRCMNRSSLKSTDKSCSPSSVIHSSMGCASNDRMIHDSNNALYDFRLYKNQITNKIPPPAIYTTEKQEYSNETVMAENNQLRHDLHNYQKQLPDIISSSMENQIVPMVKGILADNYYIQQ